MSADERLDSWKEIAGYLRRGVRTAQRWEREAGLPVRRVATDRGAVYAFRSELDAWWRGRMSAAPLIEPRARPVADPAGASSLDSGDGRKMRVRPFLSHDVGIDTDSAAGHANMAVYFFTLTAMGLLRASEGLPAARALAQRAVNLEPGHAEAEAMLAVVAAHLERDWDQATRRFTRALAREPVPPLVRFHYACWFLSPLQRHAESIEQVTVALSADPVYLIGRVQIGVDLVALGRVAEGFRALEDVLRIDPQFGPALGHLGREYAIAGRAGEAVALAERTHAAIPHHPNATGFLAGMLRRTGDAAGAEAVLAALEQTSPWAAPRARAESLVVLERWDAALDAMHEVAAQHDPGIWLLLSGTAGRTLRRLPRWPALGASLKLPDVLTGGGADSATPRPCRI